MTVSETDQRRFRILQILEVEVREQIRGDHVLDTLAGFHFAVGRSQFEDDIDWLDGRGLVRTGPCPGGTRWLSITDAGREVVDLAQPGPALRSVSLGHGAHLTLTGDEPIDTAKQQALAEAARDLVRALLEPAQVGDISPGPDRHLGAREAS